MALVSCEKPLQETTCNNAKESTQAMRLTFYTQLLVGASHPISLGWVRLSS